MILLLCVFALLVISVIIIRIITIIIISYITIIIIIIIDIIIVSTPNLPTNIVGWFQRVWLKHNIYITGWNSQAQRKFPESLNQARLVGIMLVGRLGVPQAVANGPS